MYLTSGINHCRAGICHVNVSLRVKTSDVKVQSTKLEELVACYGSCCFTNTQLMIRISQKAKDSKRRDVWLKAISRKDENSKPE